MFIYIKRDIKSEMSNKQKAYFPEAASLELFVGNLGKGSVSFFESLDGFKYFQPNKQGNPFGFIGFKTPEQCTAAFNELTGKQFNGRIIEVNRPRSYVPPKIPINTF